MSDFIAAARAYHARDWRTLPVQDKRPNVGAGWPKLRLDPNNPEHAALYNGKATGIALMLGPSGLVDLEADTLAADLALEELAPKTACSYRSPRGFTHYLYASEARHKTWKRPRRPDELDYSDEKAMQVEVRAGEHLSNLPPSRHPNGGEYQWISDGEPAEYGEAPLYRAARHAAVAGLLAPV